MPKYLTQLPVICSPTYVAPRIHEIEEAVRGARGVLLATDPDREGEAISWHVEEVLKVRFVIGAACRLRL